MQPASRARAAAAFGITSVLSVLPLCFVVSSDKSAPLPFWVFFIGVPVANSVTGWLVGSRWPRLGRTFATLGGGLLACVLALLVFFATLMMDFKDLKPSERQRAGGWLFIYAVVLAPLLAVPGLMGAIAGYVVAVDGGAPPELVPSQPKASRPGPPPLPVARAAPQRARSSAPYLLRLWRGDEPLAVTYWVWGVIVIMSSPFVLGFLHSKLLLFLFLPYPMLITIAIWRSAKNHDGVPSVAVLARVSSLMASMLLYLMFLVFGGANLLIRSYDQLR